MNPSSCLGSLTAAHPMENSPHNWKIQDSKPFLQAATCSWLFFSLIFFLERSLKNMVWIAVCKRPDHIILVFPEVFDSERSSIAPV